METTRDYILKAIKTLPNIDHGALESVLYAKDDRKSGLIRKLLDRKIVPEQEMLVILVRELKIPSIDLTKYRIDEKLKDVLPEKVARQYEVVPISSFANILTVAVSDPLNVYCIDDLCNITQKEVDIVIATPTQIKTAIELFYATASSSISIAADNLEAANIEMMPTHDEVPEVNNAMAEEAPVIRMVNLVIKQALRQRASDIHMEPTENGVRVRYRIDGILQDILTIPKENQNAVIVRIKIIAKLDITMAQIPQDGRFKMRLSGQEIDFRVSLLPTTFGQKIVLRVLDKANLSVGLSKLGFSKQSIDLLENGMHKPFGMILVTGPTGSGKSTTLYSMINKLNTVDRNIVTIEDPVEYLVEGLTQIETKADIGLTFSMGLKSVLRQSPDIVMVGEIRDGETADISIKASLTGQLVLSTLHTNDAAGAINRLVDMGLEPFLVASSLVLVCAQRLCRKICTFCKVKVQPIESAYAKIKNRVKVDLVFYEGKGCDRCRHTGYLGRLGVTEVLQVDDQIRDLIIRGKSSHEIATHAQEKQGMKLLFDDVIDKMVAGETTLAEVYRIAAEDL